ncbi:ABC-type transport auxiliary lipoprotein family protein [Hippea maritima]|uniref:ABC-type transport auxiliary lipoprotein component domain-containing protein n=1 Tax=Hippea maritima (strain ATCC 700847 / DSM 10411 / MH2) TaxID=760142 RepID=F2LVU4_HIPMA|nr:hypothetical protein [Hippea maritima]AEA33878.1 hypothetical protein Hipma_0908 [Hippea maritima DSM 10411]
MKRLILIVFLFLVGCSFHKLPPLREYTLNLKPIAFKLDRKVRKTIVVSDVDCGAPFDSTFIFFKKGKFEFDRYGNVRWIKPVCLMYKTSIEHVLNKTHLFVSGDILRPNYRLSYVIYDFEPLFLANRTYAICNIEFRLKDENNGKIYIHAFSKSIKINGNSFDDVISSLNDLFNLSLSDLINWIEKI